MRKIEITSIVVTFLLFVFLSPTFADITLSGNFKFAAKDGEPLMVTGGTIVLKNEKVEVIAEGSLIQMGPFLAIPSKEHITFMHNPRRTNIKFDGMQEPSEFVTVEFGEDGHWMVASGRLFILFQRGGVTTRVMAGLEAPCKIDLDVSLARASLVKLPKGNHILFGFNLKALEEGGSAKFVNGKIVERHNVLVD